MKGRFEGLKRFGSKAGRLLVSGVLACSLTPALALAETSLQTAQVDAMTQGNVSAQHYDPVNNSGMMAIDAEGNDSLYGGVKLLSKNLSGKATNVYNYLGYAHSDASHYRAYGLRSELTTDKNGILTSIDFTSGFQDTFAGMWGYVKGKAPTSVNGYLPDGVSFDATQLSEDQAKGSGVANPSPTMSYYKLNLIEPNGVKADDTPYLNKYGMTLGKIALISTNATGTAPFSSSESEGTKITETETSVVAPNVVAVSADQGYNLVRCTYTTKGEKMPFDTYFTVGDEGSDAVKAAEAYIDDVVGATEYGIGTSSANRDGWTSVMGGMYLRMLASWGATLENPSLASGLAGEIGGVDTVSSATKTSVPVQQALLEAQKAGYVKGVSENLQITIDRDSVNSDTLKPISVNNEPQDKTTVTVNEDGHYVVNLDFKQYGGGQLTRNAMFLFKLSGDTVGTQGMLSLAKECDAYEALNPSAELTDNTPYSPAYKYSGDGFKSATSKGSRGSGASTPSTVSGSDEHAQWALTDVGKGTITILDKDVTHIALNYEFGHGDGAIAYDLEEMAKVQGVNEKLADATASNEASVKEARAAYDALSYDVRPFTSGIETLETAEAALASAKMLLAGSSESAYAAAKAAYEALDSSAQTKVTSAAMTAYEKAIKSHVITGMTLGTTSYKYTGAEKKPSVTVKSASGSTVPSSGYTVTYSNNKKVGTATVKVTAKGSYSGTASQTFTIVKGDSAISLAAQSKTYTGKTLVYSGKVAKSGSTGKVTYKYYSNAACTKAATPKNAGTYYVKATVAADANYSAKTSSAAKFTINPAAQSVSFKAQTVKTTMKAAKKKAQAVAIKKATAKTTVTYSIAKYGNAKAKKYITKIDKKTGKITVKKGTPKGTYKVTVKASAAKGNYQAASASKVVTVKVS